MTEENQNRAPILWPILLVLAVVLWIYTTTGGGQVMVNEMLSEAYDSQAEHLLRGDPGVDADAIRHEIMLVNGKARMYFGPFPGFVRIPLNFVYQAGRGNWSRMTSFCAAMIAMGAFMGLVRMFLRTSSLSIRWRYWLGGASMVGFAFGSPLLLLLGNPSIYDEAIIWGLALALAALYFVCCARKTESSKTSTWYLLAFSLCSGATLLSRATFGAPLMLITALLAVPLLWPLQVRKLAALVLPVGVALIFYLWLSYAKFGNFSGMNLNYSINSTQREFAQKHGTFALARIPYGFADYFFLRRPVFQKQAPYIKAGREPYNHPDLYVMPFTETYSSILWSSSWILFGSIVGVVLLFRRKEVDGIDRAIAAILFLQFIGILSFMGLAQRYVAEFFPFLVFAFVLFLGKSRVVLRHSRYVLIALVVISVVINSLSTISWLLDADMNVPAQTKTKWRTFLDGAR